MKLPVLDASFYQNILPVLLLTLGSLINLIQACFKGSFNAPTKVMCVQVGSLVGAAVSLFFLPQYNYFLDGAVDLSHYASQGSLLILIISVFVSMLFWNTYRKDFFFKAEISCIYQIAISGLLVLISSQDLVTIFIGIEMSSIGLYALVGYIALQRTSLEGALKYLILGALSTGLFLFGLGLIYASCSSFNLDEIKAIIPLVSSSLWLKAGIVFIVASLGFKLALVPFHMWSPDVYQSAPTGITAFMATNIKVAIILLFIKLAHSGFGLIANSWTATLTVMTVLSILLGNILALTQTSIKRILAYSSIAHSGYMAIALCVLPTNIIDFSYSSLLFYVVSYCASSILIFGCLMFLESNECDDLQLSDFKGLAKRYPWLCTTMALALLSFAGLPPTAGFISKFFIFSSALSHNFIIVVIIGALGSALSLFYYLRIVVYMFMRQKEDSDNRVILPASISARKSALCLFVPAAFVLLLGTLLPQKTLEFLTPTPKQAIQVTLETKIK